MDIRPTITAEATLLAPHLHEALAEALAYSRRRLTGISHPAHPALLPLVLRADLRKALEERDLPEGWTLGGDPRRMEQLLLKNRSHGFDLRFLKERRRSYPGGVPPAGPSKARQQVWQSLPLDLGAAFDVPTCAATTFLWVWDLEDASDLDQGFHQRIVHTVEAGEYGRAVTCDLSLDLLPGGEIFDHLEFKGDAAETNLFAAVEIDIEKESGEQ